MTQYSMEVKLLAAINRRMRQWERKWIPLIVVWLTLVLVTCTVVPAAFGAEPIKDVSGEPLIVSVVGFGCFDTRWFDSWHEDYTATWPTENFRNPTLNRYLMQAWVDGVIVREVPLGAGQMSLDGIEISDELQFRTEHRWERGVRGNVEHTTAAATCSFFPPEDDTAWVWDSTVGSYGAFVLKRVATTGPPHKVDLQWEQK